MSAARHLTRVLSRAFTITQAPLRTRAVCAMTTADELTAAQALRLSAVSPNSVVVLAGRLAPYGTAEWGVSEKYYPCNLPRTLRRVKEAGRPSIAEFYSRVLRGSVDEEPALADEEAAAVAERVAGVTDRADVALVVRWHQLSLLSALFPGLAVRRFESAGDCWSSSIRVREYGPKACVCQTRYRRLVDTTSDDELWSLPEGAAAWPAADDVADAASDAEPPLSVDVLVSVNYGTPLRVLINSLARRGWAGRTGPAGDWLQAGQRTEAAAAPQPTIAVASSQLLAFAQLSLRPSFLPLRETPEEPSEAELTALRVEAQAALQTLAPARWLPAPPPLALLRRASAEAAEEELPSHAAVLPVAPLRALGWLADGAVATGAVILVDSRGCDTVTLRLPPERELHVCLSNHEDGFEDLAAAGAAAAMTVAFFCNHGHGSSHSRAAAYAAWAHSAAGRAAGVPPTQRVMVVVGGGLGMARAALAARMDMDALFEYYDLY